MGRALRAELNISSAIAFSGSAACLPPIRQQVIKLPGGRKRDRYGCWEENGTGTVVSAPAHDGRNRLVAVNVGFRDSAACPCNTA